MKGLFEKFGEVGRKMKEVGSLVLEAKDSLADNPFGALNSSLDALYGGSTEVRKFSFLTTKFIHEKKLLKSIFILFRCFFTWLMKGQCAQ